jgi:hypothetical protein
VKRIKGYPVFLKLNRVGIIFWQVAEILFEVITQYGIFFNASTEIVIF